MEKFIQFNQINHHETVFSKLARQCYRQSNENNKLIIEEVKKTIIVLFVNNLHSFEDYFYNSVFCVLGEGGGGVPVVEFAAYEMIQCSLISR